MSGEMGQPTQPTLFHVAIYEPDTRGDKAVEFWPGSQLTGLLHLRRDGEGKTVCGLALPPNPGGGYGMGSFGNAGRAPESDVCGLCLAEGK